MIKSLKMFAACVESLRTAEKAYEEDPTPFNKNILTDLQNKVDGWIKWVHAQEDGDLTKKVPPFIGKTLSSGYQGGISDDVYDRLMKTHTPEEVEKFTRMLKR